MMFFFLMGSASCNAVLWPRYGAKIGVRRVRATTFPPLLINWGAINDIINPGKDRETRKEDNIGESSDLNFSGGYLAPLPDFDIDTTFEDPNIDLLPPTPDISYNEEDKLTAVEESPEDIATDSDTIDEVLPSVDPLIVPQVTTCSVVEEVVYEDVIENQCTTESLTSCKLQPAECTTGVSNQCKEVTETVFEEKCEDAGIVNICENILLNQTKTECSTVVTEKCESVYQTEYKEECSYNTVIENVCSTGYSVSYNNRCRIITQTKCNRVSGCRRVPRKLCAKVPNYPTKKCRKVPRQEPVCKQVPVQRPINKCSPVAREVCTEIPFQQEIKKCVYTNKEDCKQVPVEVVKNICNEVETEFCNEPLDLCETIPTTKCEDVTVQRPKTVQKEVCNNKL